MRFEILDLSIANFEEGDGDISTCAPSRVIRADLANALFFLILFL